MNKVARKEGENILKQKLQFINQVYLCFSVCANGKTSRSATQTLAGRILKGKSSANFFKDNSIGLRLKKWCHNLLF